MAKVKKMDDGRYFVRGIIGTRKQGNRRDVRRYFDKRKDAVAFAAQVDLDDGSNHEDKELTTITFPDYYDKWANAFKIGRHSEVTDEWYTVVGGYIREWFDKEHPGLPLAEVDRVTYQAFLDWLGKTPRGKRNEPLSRSTVDRTNGYVRAVLKDAIEDGYASKDFTRRAIISGTASKDESEKYVSLAEFRRMIAIADRDADLAHVTNYVLLFMAYTGARFEEALGAQWHLIDWENQTITFEHSWQYKKRKQQDNFGPLKNKQSYRTIPIPSKLIKILKRLRAEQAEKYLADGYRDPDDLILRNDKHRVITNEAMNALVKATCMAAKTKNVITSHGLRHSHGSMLMYEGVELLAISRRLGHASLAITMRVYLHEIDEMKQRDDKKVIKALEAL